MPEHPEYALDALRQGGEFTLYRGRQRGNPLPILALALAAEQPSAHSLRRLEHEYGLAAHLDPAWAARPLTLARHDSRTMLVLSDPGGEPLDRLLDGAAGQPLELTRFLRVAIGLAQALGHVHAHGLIHKDIKPANVLVDDDSNVRLTGFGIASRLPHERQAPAPPEIIAGTLAYMAPEQTGRMNRAMDARSDLYSLGITLYQMLTGTLPFAAADPLEWVHCHIARQPTPPDERAAVPELLSRIVMKLLAKNAEERYQSASGLEADLRRCLAEYESQGRIDPFPLAADDVWHQLQLPPKLYGRERETEALLAAFERVVADGTPELVLVSGYSGIGKSSLINELHKVLVPPRGLFASGKFDQYQGDIPYATLTQAFQTLIRQVLANSEAEVARWRHDLAEAMGPNGQLIVDLVPELEFVVGKQLIVPDLPGRDDARPRFQTVFRRFLEVFARKEHPLVLLLDDLQWLDQATLDLLEHLITHAEMRHLLLIGAYRDNEVGPAHPLRRTLDAIRATEARVLEIALAPLAVDDANRLLADALHCGPERVRALTQLVHEKTGGNPLFAGQFLATLADEGLLAFESVTRAWQWDIDRIRAKSYTDNVVELIAVKLKRLSAPAREALKQLACLGNIAEIATLALVHGVSAEAIDAALGEAVRAGLVLHQEGTCKFLHDRIQQAAYSLIPEAQRAGVHLDIGRMLLASTAADGLAEHLFEIVDQLNRGAALIDARDERERLAELNLVAGQRAKASTAHASALAYFAIGATLLGGGAWQRRHELAFALELNRAECEFLTGALSQAEERSTALSARAATTIERASVTCLRADLYTTLDQGSCAIAIALDYLRHLDIDWSPHPTAEEARREYERIWAQLGSRAIERLIDLPLMTDPAILATLDVLAKMATPALYTDADLYLLVICRQVNLGLEHGHCDASCFAYEWLAMVAGARFGDYQAAYSFGRLGHDLVEQRGLKRFEARTSLVFGGLVIPWTRHVKSGRDLLRRAFEVANKSGDPTYAAYSCDQLNTNMLAAGDSLAEAQREIENGLEFARKVRFGLVVDLISAARGIVRTLRGLTRKFGSFDDEQFDEHEIERRFAANPDLQLAECWYSIRKLQARFFAGDHATALAAAGTAQRLLWTSVSRFETAEYHFYSALAHAASCDSAAGEQRRRHLEAVAAHHEQLEAWAENCPENFANRAALVGAEIARIEGRVLDAMPLYEQAIRSAREHGFVQNEALAHELVARFYLGQGLDTIGRACLRNARSCYDRWGALGKVKQLDEQYLHLREEPTLTSATATIGEALGLLDVETVVKASQALSSEIVLPSLIEKLMRIAVEHAGAERGLLILLHRGEPQIEAEATTSLGRIDVAVRRAALTSADLPRSALHYAIRTRHNVVLDDASANSLYASDEYVRRRHPRSVLCLPIVNQTKLVGALYLENNLTPRAFTSDRIAVLDLLASQAAISLENARLYSDLQRSEAFLAQGQSISSTGSWDWSVPSGRITWSQQTFRIFEYEPTVTPTVELVLQRVHPEDRALARRVLAKATSDGTNFETEYRLLLPDDRVKHLHVLAHAVADRSGDVEFVGAVMDVTERKLAEAERERLGHRLRQAEKMEAVGRLAGGIAHDFNNVLGGILAYGEMLLDDAPSGSSRKRYAQNVLAAASRGRALVEQILAYSRSQHGKREPVDIVGVAAETLELVRGSLPVDIVLESSSPTRPLTVIGDATRLHQVVMNLCSNAIQAMSGGGMLRVRLRTAHFTSARTFSHGTLEPGRYVHLTVEDTGSGMDDATLARIFEPFFTTKEIGQGTGLGLWLVYAIISDLPGAIDVRSTLGRGSAFAIYLPLAPS